MTERLTDEALQALVKQATPGPWRVAGKATGYIVHDAESVVVGVIGDYRDTDLLPYNKDRWDGDCALIAVTPAIAAEVLELRETKASVGLAIEAMHQNAKAAFDEYEAEITALKARVEAYRMALDPNCTKGLYLGEFTSDARKGGPLSWTLIKQIMHRIRMTADAMEPVAASRTTVPKAST